MQGGLYQRFKSIFWEDEKVPDTQPIISDIRYTKRKTWRWEDDPHTDTERAISLWWMVCLGQRDCADLAGLFLDKARRRSGRLLLYEEQETQQRYRGEIQKDSLPELY